MQTATENLKKSLDRQTPVYGKSIMLYRKLWTGSAYVFDTPVEILDEIIDAGKIMWKLDKEGFNVWSVGNTTLTIRNHRNQWKQNNPKGFFPSGYLLHGSKVVIRAGAQLADGTFENPYIFTGYITTDPIKGTAEKTAVITLEASMAIFGMFNAEEISNPIIDEQHDYSAPDIVDYNTINNGVAAVGFVVKRGATAGGAGLATEIFPTTGYTIQNQNLKTLPITVTLVSALTDTESLWFTYKYWYQDKTLEWLVAQVCALCGVTSTSITPAIFSSSAETIWDFNSQADWNTCTLSNIDTITTPGSFKIGLIDDFGDGDYTANPSWELIIGDASIESGHLKLSWNGTHSSSTVKLPFTTMVGNWQFRMWSNTFSNARFWIIGGTPNVFNILDDGYYIDIGNDSIAKRRC